MTTFKEEMDNTSNPTVYKKARKRELENSGEIDCSYCPYHQKENITHKYQRSWKRSTKRKHQEKGRA